MQDGSLPQPAEYYQETALEPKIGTGAHRNTL
jgi:hypothetical protein